MFAVTGMTGKVGGVVAQTLRAAGVPVRAVVRDAGKAAGWDVAVADMADAAALTAAFAGAEGVFILPPSEFDPAPGFAEARRVIAAVRAALVAARPARVVCLSTIGADAAEENLLTQRTLMEAALRDVGVPVTFLRPGWFMENAAWDVAAARDEGVLRSFLQPVDQGFAMVATADVGRVAAGLLREDFRGVRVVELAGPDPVSPRRLAAAFAAALGRDVRVEVVARDSWEGLFRGQGMRHPGPRMRMLDGFNEGWIRFSGDVVRGVVTVEDLVARLVAG